MEWKSFRHEVPGVELLSSDAESECYYEHVRDFVADTGYLPIECRECYKAFIFWPYSEANERAFLGMLDSLPVSVHGKYNARMVLFHFKAKTSMLTLVESLRDEVRRTGFQGMVHWRVSGGYWQDAYPHFFKSAQELKPVQARDEITMKEWLQRRGIVQ